MLLEICVDSLESAMAAQQGGANRVELCSNLNIGGTTPSQGLIKLAINNLSIDVFVMIRPRGGDFCYTNLEYEVIKEDIKNAKRMGADGIVIGILKTDGTIDTVRMKEVIKLAQPLKVTFHRAFDKTRDLFESLDTLIALGVDRVLTSGGENKAANGISVIKELVKRANNKIVIMPGSGVNITNVIEIVNQTKVKEIHLSAREKIDSKMEFRNLKINAGGNLIISEHENFVASKKTIEEIANSLNNL